MDKIKKVLLIIVVMFISVSFSINLLIKIVKIDKDDYIKVLLAGPINDNIFKDTINIFTYLDPTYFIEIPSYKLSYTYNSSNNPDIVLFSSSNNSYKNEFSFSGNSNLASYLLYRKLNNINVLFIDNLYDYLYLNNISLDSFINDLYVKYSNIIIIDIGISSDISISSNIDNFLFSNYIYNYLSNNYNISRIYINDFNYIKIDIGSSNDTISNVLKYIDYISNSIKDYYGKEY